MWGFSRYDLLGAHLLRHRVWYQCLGCDPEPVTYLSIKPSDDRCNVHPSADLGFDSEQKPLYRRYSGGNLFQSSWLLKYGREDPVERKEALYFELEEIACEG